MSSERQGLAVLRVCIWGYFWITHGRANTCREWRSEAAHGKLTCHWEKLQTFRIIEYPCREFDYRNCIWRLIRITRHWIPPSVGMDMSVSRGHVSHKNSAISAEIDSIFLKCKCIELKVKTMSVAILAGVRRQHPINREGEVGLQWWFKLVTSHVSPRMMCMHLIVMQGVIAPNHFTETLPYVIGIGRLGIG